LREAGVPSFTLAAELLLSHVADRNRAWLYAHPEDEIGEEAARRFLLLIDRRIAGEPVQHLTGKQEFWGLEFEVNKDVLIPRPETEHVIEVALDRMALRELRAGRPQKTMGQGLRIADIGAGSGCIAIALAKELPHAKLYATDISSAALAVAARNAARHGVSDRIHFIECDLLSGLPQGGTQQQSTFEHRDRNDRKENAFNRLPTDDSPVTAECPTFDLIVSNPPYIGRREAITLTPEVRDHEPQTALYGGEEGYELYGDLIVQAERHLKSQGILVLELGHNSLPAVQPLLDPPVWRNVGITSDLAGIRRVIAAEKV
jgi:release factor glutamine methyltransferase